MAADSIRLSPSLVTSVGTRPSGLYSRMRSKSRPTDQLACSKGMSSSFIVTATRRTNGESNIPISSIQRVSRSLLKIGQVVDDSGGDDHVDHQEPEEKPAPRRATPRLELGGEHRILGDVPVEPLLRLSVADALGLAQHFHGLGQLA